MMDRGPSFQFEIPIHHNGGYGGLDFMKHVEAWESAAYGFLIHAGHRSNSDKFQLTHGATGEGACTFNTFEDAFRASELIIKMCDIDALASEKDRYKAAAMLHKWHDVVSRWTQ